MDMTTTNPCTKTQRFAVWVAFGVVGLTATGCQQTPYLPGGPGAPAQTIGGVPVAAGNSAQVAELTRRVSELDRNNKDLHMEVANLITQRDLNAAQLQKTKEELKLTAQRLDEANALAQNFQNQARTLQASVQQRGGASIQPNTNLAASAARLQLNPLVVQQDGSSVRIVLPSDQLFEPNTARMLPRADQMLAPVAAQLRTVFPKQRIDIEGHTDSTSAAMGGPAVSHQLASAQASAILDALTRRANMPAAQFSVKSEGIARPVQSNETPAGRAANRRIELVVRPDLF
jgi:chemotaxis protein MotB